MKTIIILVCLVLVAFFLMNDSQKRAAEKERLEEAEKGKRALLLEMERDRLETARQLEENARAAEEQRRAAQQRTPVPGAWMNQDTGNPLDRRAFDRRHY